MPISLLLFFEFFKTGLFTFGGGLASLPFLYHICHTYNWFSEIELTQLIAISSLTPGPIGMNMATFAGFKTLGIVGAIVASVGLIIPMFIVASLVFRLYKKFSENNYVKSILYFLRPTSAALLSYVGAKLFYNLVLGQSFSLEMLNYKALFILFVLFLMTFKLPRNPIIYMSCAGLFGAIFFILGW